MLGQIAQLDGIVDIEINKAPIEQIVAELYTRWRLTQRGAVDTVAADTVAADTVAADDK